MVSVIADVLDRLGRVPEVPIKQLTTTVLPQLLLAHSREKQGPAEPRQRGSGSYELGVDCRGGEPRLRGTAPAGEVRHDPAAGLVVGRDLAEKDELLATASGAFVEEHPDLLHVVVESVTSPL